MSDYDADRAERIRLYNETLEYRRIAQWIKETTANREYLELLRDAEVRKLLFDIPWWERKEEINGEDK